MPDSEPDYRQHIRPPTTSLIRDADQSEAPGCHDLVFSRGNLDTVHTLTTPELAGLLQACAFRLADASRTGRPVALGEIDPAAAVLGILRKAAGMLDAEAGP